MSCYIRQTLRTCYWALGDCICQTLRTCYRALGDNICQTLRTCYRALGDYISAKHYAPVIGHLVTISACVIAISSSSYWSNDSSGADTSSAASQSQCLSIHRHNVGRQLELWVQVLRARVVEASGKHEKVCTQCKSFHHTCPCLSSIAAILNMTHAQFNLTSL